MAQHREIMLHRKSLDLYMPERLVPQVASGLHNHRLLNYSLAAFRPNFKSRNARSGEIHIETMKRWASI